MIREDEQREACKDQELGVFHMSGVSGEYGGSGHSTSVPRKSFLSNCSSFRNFSNNGNIGSPRSFRTAQSSIASYVTAPRGSPPLDLAKFSHNMERWRRTDSTVSQNEVKGSVQKNVAFTSEWIEHLKERGLLLDPAKELDWSGKGQHVEYGPTEINDIPLQVEKVLGHSATALVESVRCRRIRLARKKIRCNRRLSKKEAITEVEHLQKLAHRHIIRVVGTYTWRQELSILLYPSCDYNLEELMDDMTVDLEESMDGGVASRHDVAITDRVNSAMWTFFGCLSRAISYIHSHNIKHMDIKPTNLLIKNSGLGSSIYIADFGIARSYQSAAESETDSPTSFTRAYAAPEVVLQDTRGFKADVFSLGCVFVELAATLSSGAKGNLRKQLQDLRNSSVTGDTSYHANIDAIRAWFCDISEAWDMCTSSPPEQLQCLVKSNAANYMMRKYNLCCIIILMVQTKPALRPSAEEVAERTRSFQCGYCHLGPEAFKAVVSPPASTTPSTRLTVMMVLSLEFNMFIRSAHDFTERLDGQGLT